MVYLTYTSLRMRDFKNMQSDWSRTKLHEGGVVPIKESVATENASRPTKENKRGEMLPGYSTQLWLYCTRLLLKRHQKPSRNKRYPTEPTRRQLDSSRVPPTSIHVSAQPTFFCNATSVFHFSYGPPYARSGRYGSLRRLPSFLLY